MNPPGAIVGPLPCQGCGKLKWWTRTGFVTRAGIAHSCGLSLNHRSRQSATKGAEPQGSCCGE